jgi:uncharacterized membrane protein
MWILWSFLSALLIAVNTIGIKQVMKDVHPFDITLYGIPAFLVHVLVLGRYRYPVGPVSYRNFIKISVLSLVGTASMYFLRFSHRVSKNGYPSAIAAASSVVIMTLAAWMKDGKSLSACEVISTLLIFLGVLGFSFKCDCVGSLENS